MSVRSYPSAKGTVPITEGNLNPRTLEENRRVLEARFTLPEVRFDLIARLLGGAAVELDLPASSSAEESADAFFDHTVGRMLSTVVLAVALDGLGGQVFGHPDGGLGASGGNQGAWSATQVRLRASRAATFYVVVA